MKLQSLAAVATIFAALLTGLQYCNSTKPPTNTSNIAGQTNTSSRAVFEKTLKEEREEVIISERNTTGSKQNEWLASMHAAAKKIPYSDQERDALLKVVTASIEQSDYNRAILCADDIPYADAQAAAYLQIVKAAVQKREFFPYAVKAAEKIPYSDKQAQAMSLIVDAYGSQVKSKLDKPTEVRR